MEGTKYKVMVFLLLLFAAKHATGNNPEIYAAFITGDMQRWQKMIDRMDLEKENNAAVLAELVNYQYGFIGWCVGNKKYDDARKYLERAYGNLEALAKVKGYESLVYAYQSAFYGYRIGMNYLQAPILGPKSIECARKSILLDRNNAFGYVQCGNTEFYMPKIFGGSKAEALRYYLKAQEIMERNDAVLKNDWNYLSLLTVIAQTYSYLGDRESSRHYLDRILSIEPRFEWIRNELYPQIMIRTEN